MTKKSRRMKANPVSPSMAIGFAVVGLALGAAALYSSEAMASPKKPNGCAPYKYDQSLVRAAIGSRIDSGDRDGARIAIAVATSLYGEHPSGTSVTFPPPSTGSLRGVQCVWGRVLNDVDVVFEERDVIPGGGPIEIIPINPIDGLSGYPWETPAVDPENYPTPGMFMDPNLPSDFQWSRGMAGAAEAILNSALAMAASLGMDVSFAQTTMKLDASKSAIKRRLITDMRELTQCGKHNDGLFGVGKDVKNRYPGSWPDYIFGPNGRTIMFLPQHNDTLAQMRQGKAPKRAVRVNGEHISGQGRRQPQVWIPAINLQMLAGNSPTVSAMTWSDGSSTMEPPPIVQRLGVDMSGVSLPGGPGCR